MDQAIVIAFIVFLLALIILDIAMIVSLVKPGDERKQLIVWKASAFTLLATVLGLVWDIIEALAWSKPSDINPFINLSVIATLYCISLLYYKKKHGD